MKIGYVYDETIGLHNYGKDHPMNPIRILMTHSLVHSYGLDSHMTLYAPTKVPLTYHSEEYMKNLGKEETDDCPNFDNVVDFAERYSSASINAAQLINCEEHKCVVNWAGGLHHAHKNEPSGFCFANDIVMCIQELLCKHERVMYIDIDVHHGDGIEEAFYDNDRVLTVSLHKHGDGFFPQTGDLVMSDKRAVNVPLQTGIVDAGYKYIYEPIISNAIRKFKPNAIVFQAGADSLAEDRLGMFNLSMQGHGSCLKFVQDYDIPMVVLGGGGYTIHNVARCWAYETSVLCNIPVNQEIPSIDPFYEHYEPQYLLAPQLISKHRIDFNGKKYLDSLLGIIQEKIDKF